MTTGGGFRRHGAVAVDRRSERVDSRDVRATERTLFEAGRKCGQHLGRRDHVALERIDAEQAHLVMIEVDEIEGDAPLTGRGEDRDAAAMGRIVSEGSNVAPPTALRTASTPRPPLHSRTAATVSPPSLATKRSSSDAAGEPDCGGLRSIPMTRAPSHRPICTAAPPTPPLEPMTASVSAALSSAYSASAIQAAKNVTPTDAACEWLSVCGLRRKLATGTAMRSA